MNLKKELINLDYISEKYSDVIESNLQIYTIIRDKVQVIYATLSYSLQYMLCD